MTQIVNIAVIGCGGVSRAHFAAYDSHPDARLYAAVDVSDQLAQRAAETWHADRWFDSVDAALADPAIDAVDLCLPHDLHAPVAIMAAKAGKHVFVEKPIANTIDEADSMINAANEAGVILMVDQTKRYQRRHQRVKEIIASGALGEIVLARLTYPQDITPAWQAMPAERLRTYWKHDGVISGIGIHGLDLLRWMVGEVESVQAIASTSSIISPERRTEDSGIVLLRFANGAIGEVLVSYVMKAPQMAANWDLMPLEIYGDKGSVTLDMNNAVSVFPGDSDGWGELGTLTLSGKRPIGAPPLPPDGMVGAAHHFIECVIGRAEPLTDGLEARRSLELVAAAYESIRTGAAVAVSSGT